MNECTVQRTWKIRDAQARNPPVRVSDRRVSAGTEDIHRLGPDSS
jgi:hypothetical protein